MRKEKDQFYTFPFSRELLPDCIEALRQKFMDIQKIEGNTKKDTVMEELKKVFYYYKIEYKASLKGDLTSQKQKSEGKSQCLQPVDVNLSISKFSEQQFLEENPKYLCCLKFVFEGKLNYSNIEHDFISIPLDEERGLKRSLIENAICGGLNFEKDVVLMIGLNFELKIVGIPYTKHFQADVMSDLKKICDQSIRPKINFYEILQVKFIPILKRDSYEETDNCLITISMKKQTDSFYYISIDKRGYAPIYLQYGCQKNKPIANNRGPLEIIQLKEENIYQKVQENSTKKIKKKRMHFGQCSPARGFISQKEQPMRDESKQFINLEDMHFIELIKGGQQYQNITIIKFQSKEEKFEHMDIMKQIRMELQYQRQPFIIQKWKCKQNQGKANYAFLFLIMHDHHPQVVKNTLGVYKNGPIFQYGSVKLYSKIIDFKSNDELNGLRKMDTSFSNLFSQIFPENSVQRFYTISNQNIRKVYYKINKNLVKESILAISAIIYMINIKLNLKPLFVDEHTINSPRYHFPLNK